MSIQRAVEGSNVRTFTKNRDNDELYVEAATGSDKKTVLTVRRNGKSFRFSGTEARTLQRLLDKHYAT